MSVSYKKLWKLLIDKDMKKKDLCEKAGISPASVTKMGRNGHVTTEILVKICAALDCGIEDIIEIVPDEKQPSNRAEPGRETAPDQPDKPRMTDFKPVMSRRRAGTGCITQINDHLFEGRYSPMWIDGKKHSRNVYAHTREECEEKLKVLIAEMKAELAELKRQKADRH